MDYIIFGLSSNDKVKSLGKHILYLNRIHYKSGIVKFEVSSFTIENDVTKHSHGSYNTLPEAEKVFSLMESRIILDEL